MIRIAAIVTLALALALPARAQMAASLVADRVSLSDGVLVAEGNVTAFAEGARLSAARITYDGAADRLDIAGPVVITAADGSILTATQAQLDPALERGLLLGARLVLERRLQLAAARADRAGALTQLTGVAVTSCQVCPGRAPLWEIRAARVVHDAQAQRLWFDNAQVRLRGVPIAWAPRLSLPDPTVQRARGVLLPRITSSDRLGLGLQLPVFIPLGASRDLTLTPWLSQNARAGRLRYRQAFASGDLDITALLAEDSLRDSARGYVTADAAFRLPHRVQMRAGLELISDRAVLLDYGISDKDRLQSDLSLTRVTGRRLSMAHVAGYESLRSTEDNATLPWLTARLRHSERVPLAGGLLSWQLDGDAHQRRSDVAGDGRDAARIGAGAGFTRRWVFGPGLVLDGTAMLRADAWALNDALPTDESGTRLQAGAQLALGWPLIRRGRSATHVIEPRISLGWSDARGITPPNEDSARIAFDETTLHALTRAPGEDLTETGTQAALGLTWTMQHASGTATRLGFGRVLRDDPVPGIAPSSGLAGTRSDWLLSAGLDLPGGFSLDSRSLVGRTRVSRSESRIRWDGARVDLDATHVFLSADPAENRPDDVSEWTLNAAWQASQSWDLSAGARYDIASDRPVSAKLGATWRNECVSVGISASHRFTTLDNVPPSTDFGLELSIEGFSATTGGARPARACR